jgi:hypothetical protein
MSVTEQVIDAVVNALNEWDKLVQECQVPSEQFRIQELDVLVGELLFALGHFEKKPTIDALKERMGYLINDIGIDRFFLLDGIAIQIKNRLKRNIEKHGEDILTMGNIAQSLDEKGVSSSLAKERLSKLKDFRYYSQALVELNIWEKVMNDRMGVSIRQLMEMKSKGEAASKAMAYLEKIP